MMAVLRQDSPLEALASWARDRYSLRWPLRACVLKFIRSYQERPGEPRPFVGRAAVLRELDDWLLQGQERLRLLSGAAGRGKSALLLHWMGGLIHREPRITLFYLPISIRFNTADESSGVQLLFAALCDVFSNLQERLAQQPETQDYLEGIQAAWQQMALRPGQAFLLVVDGLDEAINQWFLKRHLLPTELPPNLHVLMSARHKPGHTSGMAWLFDLEGRDRASEHQVVEIRTLEREAMAEAVSQLGLPLDALPERPAFIEHLYRLTDGGDPLLLTLWLAQIWRQRAALPDLNPGDLARLQPGFGELYQLWMKEQRSLWDAMGLDLDPDDFGQVMQVLAAAQGPMQLGDLVEVLGELNGAARWGHPQLRAVLETAHRLIVGDGTGYVLVHPRLAQYFQEELEADPLRRNAVRGAFLKWGAATVLRLNSGELQPEACPAYLLTHYVAAHLGASDGPQGLPEDYLPLLRQGWPRAWYAREGAWHGYLNDLQQLTGRLQASNQEALRAGDHAHLSLALEVRCALLAGSIRSLIGNLPGALLESLAREGVWSLARATNVARQYEAGQKARSLTELAAVAAHRGEPTEAQSLLQEALEAAATIPDEIERTHALTAVAAQLQGAAQRTLFRQALTLVGTLQHQRAIELGMLVPQLQGDSALLQQALEVATAIQNPDDRAYALKAVAAQLQGEARHAVLLEALAAAALIEKESARVQSLNTLAPRLQAEARRAVLEQALQAAAAIPEGWSRACALMAVAAQMQGDSALLHQVLQVAAAIEDEGHRAHTLGAVAAQLQGDARHTVLQQALAVAAALHDPVAHASVLCAIAGHLQGESQNTVLQQALAASLLVQRESQRAEALSAVAARLQTDSPLLQRVLEAADDMGRGDDRASVLSAVAARLQGEARQRLLQAALAAWSPESNYLRAQTLSDMAAQLQGEARYTVLQQALTATAAIGYETQRAITVNALAAEFRGDGALLQRALELAAAIREQGTRAHVVVSIARQLRSESALWQQALEVAAAIQDGSEQAGALLALATQLQGESKRTVLQRALTAIAATWGRAQYARDLNSVVAQLQADSWLLQQALAVAAASPDADDRASALTAVAKHLQGDAKRSALQQALTAAAAIQDETVRSCALRTLAEPLQGEPALLQRSLEMAQTIEDGCQRVRALSALAAQLQGEAQRAVVQQALTAATAMAGGLQRACALCDVAAQLQGETHRTVVRQALEDAAIQGDCERAFLLNAAAPQLQADTALSQRALEIAMLIQDDYERATALRAVVPRLPADGELLEQALAAARGISNACPRADALGVVAARLQGETRRTVLEEGLQGAMAIKDEGDKVKTLSVLAEQLQGEHRRAVLTQALRAVATIEGLWERADTLCALAGQLSQYPLLQGVCLQEVLALAGTDNRRILACVTLLRQNPSLLTYDLWLNLLNCARLDRRQLLNATGDLAWCAVALTGRPAQADEIASAIHEVCGWFP